MNFASLQFAGFLLLLLLANALLRKHEHRNMLLLLTSYYFYACWDPRSSTLKDHSSVWPTFEPRRLTLSRT